MALARMNVTRAKVRTDIEILWNSDYIGSAITLDEAAFVDGVCKAGTPIGEGGMIVNDETALGVLLHDVALERPQGTIVIGGYINTPVAEEHSGVTITAEAKAAMKNVVFMDDAHEEEV